MVAEVNLGRDPESNKLNGGKDVWGIDLNTLSQTNGVSRKRTGHSVSHGIVLVGG